MTVLPLPAVPRSLAFRGYLCRLLRWNRWWGAQRDIDGYLAWGSDGDNRPETWTTTPGAPGQGGWLNRGSK